MTAKSKTFPELPHLPSGMKDPEVLAMFNELAEIKYQQYLDEEEAEKKIAPAAAQGYANAQSNLGTMYDNGQGVTQDYKGAVAEVKRKLKTSTADGGPKDNWAPWLTDPDPDQPEMSKAQSKAAAKAVKIRMEQRKK